jgi:hypothetical protein
MIDLLIQQLTADIKNNEATAKKTLPMWADSKKSMIAEVNGDRASARAGVQRRDAEIKSVDKSKSLALSLEVEIKSLQQTLKSTRAHRKIVKARCVFERKVGAQKQHSARRQIRVLKQVIAMLRNQQLSKQVVSMIKGVKLSLPIWQKGAWSKCSKSCGPGKQTRSVSCSGAKCLGNKPRTVRLCNKGACKGDCILSAWSTWSECSAKCNGGVKTSTRKVLARAVNGGKACPSSLGLIRKRSCNKKACASPKKARSAKRV